MAYTYTALKAAIESFVADVDATFDAAIDSTILPNAEVRLLKDLNLEIFDTVGGVNFVTGNPAVTKPSGYLGNRTLMFVNGTTRSILRERSYEFIVDYAPDTSVTGAPLYFCDLNDTQFMVGPAPNATVTGSCRYMKRPTAMSVSNGTTWLGTNVGELLLKGCLFEAAIWMQSAPRMASYQKDYTDQLATTRTEIRHLVRTETRGAQ